MLIFYGKKNVFSKKTVIGIFPLINMSILNIKKNLNT